MSAVGAHQPGEVVLVRHAETEWSLNGRHTGLTDLPLTERGRARAAELAPALARFSFALVLTSPSRRARETAELCGLGERASVRDDLHEWDYGDYEGLTTPQIHVERPDWNLWRDGCPGGEAPAQVGARADRVIAELRASGAEAAVFSHGHMLRVLGARWIGLEPAGGAHLKLSTAAVSVLGYERDAATLNRWGCAAP
ncbi:MAG TPA: histidine phosphatase family protein [Solirubrobacteraceae bacterium]|jgi:broad specificity phosphatase PhoE|nr:histidine phosphatase family protein [Solirubrobacteraceae bacterium]